jgi:hypothetical protein
MISVAVLAVVAGGVVSLGAGVLLLNKGWQRRQRRALEQVAIRLGGQVRHGGTLTGGVLELSPEGLGTVTLRHGTVPGGGADKVMRLDLEIPRLLPELRVLPRSPAPARGMGLSQRVLDTGLRRFDERFELRVSDPDAVGDLLEPELLLKILALDVDGGRGIELGFLPDPGRGVTVISVGRGGWLLDVAGLVGFIEQGVDLARGVVERLDRPWMVVARRFGLTFACDPRSGRPSLTGEAQGVPVRLWENTLRRSLHTDLELRQASLTGLRVEHPPQEPDPVWERLRVPTRNPVIDMCLAARCDDPEALVALFADDHLSACLLEAVHAHPGSMLTEHAVVLHTPGPLNQGLEPFLEQGLRLAQALRVRMEALGIEPCDACGGEL